MIVFSGVQIQRGPRFLLDNANATVNAGQKAGLVGKNGCGKSTLLALIKGEISTDSGSCMLPHTWTLAWVNQETPALEIPAIDYVIDGDRELRTLEADLETAVAKNDVQAIANIHTRLDIIQAWTIHSRAATLLNGLGFSQEKLSQPVCSFSGGWRMRLNLAQALICRSDLLLLDEPTNHLDLDAIIWLEKWLKNYPGTLIIVSHDRDFLDSITDKILYIEHQKIYEYSGNYSSFERQRSATLAQQQALYRQQQEKVAQFQQYIDRFRAQATKAKQAQSRIKMLERMVLIAPAHVDNPFHFSFRTPENLPNPLIKMEKVSVGYSNCTILHSIKLNIVPGSRIGLLGQNGAGKSTLIKLLANTLRPQKGEFNLAKGVRLGYFAQHQLDILHPDESPLQHISHIAGRESEQQLRDYLGGFGFHGDKALSPVTTFSGGEKARLVLALLVWQRPNLLLLDEPTNHLDLDMRQALTEALMNFSGALIVVSHDRHLLRSVTNDFYLVHDSRVEPFEGCLDDYQQWLTDLRSLQNSSSNTPAKKMPDNQGHNKKDKKRHQLASGNNPQSLRKQLLSLEKELEKLSAELAAIEIQLNEPALYSITRRPDLDHCLQQQMRIKAELEVIEMNWLNVQEQLETIS